MTTAVPHSATAAWVAAHRATVLFLVTVVALVAAGAVTLVLAFSRDGSAVPSPTPLQQVEDTCFGAPRGAAC